MSHQTIQRCISFFVVFTFFLIASIEHSEGSSSIWVEGENLVSIEPATIKPDIQFGPADVFSDGKWLKFNVEANKVESIIPETGCVFTYNVKSSEAVDYDFWLHVGFEKIRSPIEWRIDQGEWKTISPEDYTVDIRELGVWAPFGWLNAGKIPLTVGDHTLQFRITRTKNPKDGKYADAMFALDAFCFVNGVFHPTGGIKPGDTSWMTEDDKAASTHVFDIPVPVDAGQSAVSLAGLWQYTGDDESDVRDRLGPETSIPSGPETFNWRAIKVPGDRNKLMPKETYVHRFYLRTKLNVPADLAGHSVVLHIPNPSMIATVFVNGQQAGWTKLPLAAWDCDITDKIKPGQVNEVWVAFKDYFYGLSGMDKMQHPHPAYVPLSFWRFNLTLQLDMPVLGQQTTGFVWNEPSIIVGGKAYTSDVFTISSVKNKTLGLEITVHNPTKAPITASLSNEVQPLDGGAAEKIFAPQTVTIAPGQNQVVKLSEAWTSPKLWWTDDPQQYNVITRLSVDGKPIDERKTKFGFREWSWDGPDFKLNGIPWHGFADIDTENIAKLKERGQSMVRVWWNTEKTADYLDECDAKGMPVRRTGILDGEGAAGFYNLDKPELWDNYRAQLSAWIKGQRNHPSIFIWSIENEITFINGHCTGHDKVTTVEMKKAAELVMALDPTRPLMVDGGNALLDESLPVYGGHYMEAPLNTLPAGAYNKEEYSHRQVWPITQNKPILFGEAAYVTGTPLAEHATVAGEAAFLGKSDARPGIATELRMFSEAYRWLGINFHFWATQQLPMVYKAWQPIAILSRHWDWTFTEGEKATRTLGIFNDTRNPAPITFNWNLTVAGKKISGGSSTHTIAPGTNEKFDEVFTMPASVSAREEGILSLSLTQNNKEVFTDSKEISILPSANKAGKGLSKINPVAVFDPEGSLKTFLTKIKIPFIEVADLAHLPAAPKVLIIGKDALDDHMSTSSSFAAWASLGKVVVFLEQKNQLKFQGLPSKMETATNAGSIGILENPDHPILAGFKDKDFLDGGADGIVYRNAYEKPVSGGKSLVRCDMKLANSSLVQMDVGTGTLLLSQLLIGEKLKENIVAQHLLINLLSYANQYKLSVLDSVVMADKNEPLKKAVDAIGLKYTQTTDVATTLKKPGSIAILDGNAELLKALAADPAKVTAFTQPGGWIILNNVGPDSLADFNKLVGVDHIMRPFIKEKVSWSKLRNPLAAGISGDNINLGNGKSIVNFQAGEWPDPNAYSYVVDLDDVAPFGKSSYFGWNNAVNNFTQADGSWQLIMNLPADQALIPITLPRPEKIKEFTWVSDNNYQGTTKIQLSINGKDYLFDTEPNGDPQTFPIADEPTTSELTVKVMDWTHLPEKMAGEKKNIENIGIDNIYIKVERPADFSKKVKPFLNIGAIVVYPMGKGGVILCNIKFRDTEENPANKGKKQQLFSGILRNLKAEFAGGKTVIAGSNLVFTPIDISKQANQFRGEQGWFGDKQHTFDNLPTGKQSMADVTYDIYHFSTSIVPEALMLGGNGIPGKLADKIVGIPVGQKADALFFLQAARIDARRTPDEITKKKKYEMADYIIHYADGKDEKVPIYSEISVENYNQKTPTALPDAQIAWTSPYSIPGSNAVAYSMQWNNPRPDVEIKSIDLVYGPDRRGVPAVLAISAAHAP